MKHCGFVLVVGLCFAAAQPAAAQSQVSIKFDNGLVTLVAKDAPLRTILAEWSRVGGSKIVNAERVGGTPVTREWHDSPERQVLGVLLQDIGGHVAASRSVTPAGASTLDRIFLLPTPRTLQQATATVQAPPAAASPVVRFIPGEPDDDQAFELSTGVQRRTDNAQQQLRDAAAAAAAARAAQEEDAARRPRTPPSMPTFPGVGTSTPGVITPVTRPRNPDDDER
jgi:hypothetical protein